MNNSTNPASKAPKNMPPKRVRPPPKPATSTPSTSVPSATTGVNSMVVPQRAVSPLRRDRISREVFLLTGGVTPPPLMPVLPQVKNAKPVQKRGWVWRSFTNPARTDGLALSHWERTDAPSSDYAFARFNKPIRMIRYIEVEYRPVLANLLPLNVQSGDSDKIVAKVQGKATKKDKGNENADGKATSLNTKVSNADQSSQSQPVANSCDKDKRSDNSGVQKALNSNAATSATMVPAEPRPSPPSPIPQREHATRRSSPNIAQPVASTPSQSPRASPARSMTTSPPPNATLQGNLKNGIHYVPPQKPWTKVETDTLFKLCAQFDLRFVVIHDRWPDELDPRSVDELKDRFYSVSKRIIEQRSLYNANYLSALAPVLQKHCQAINMNPFDYEYECIRKNQLLWQYGRSKAELREEEETVREARRIEANRKRAAKERQRLAKLLTPAGDIAMVGNGKRGVDQALAAAAVAASLPQKTFPHRKVLSGAYARSSMIYTPISQSSRVAKRIDAALVELGVGTRPTPTTIVVDNFDLLRMDILSYIELQRTVLRKEEDTHLLRVKVAKLKGESPPAPPAGVTLSHKKRRAEDLEVGSLFGGPPLKQQKVG